MLRRCKLQLLPSLTTTHFTRNLTQFLHHDHHTDDDGSLSPLPGVRTDGTIRHLHHRSTANNHPNPLLLRPLLLRLGTSSSCVLVPIPILRSTLLPLLLHLSTSSSCVLVRARLSLHLRLDADLPCPLLLRLFLPPLDASQEALHGPGARVFPEAFCQVHALL